MPEREFVDVQRELENVLSKLKGTTGPNVKETAPSGNKLTPASGKLRDNGARHVSCAKCGTSVDLAAEYWAALPNIRHCADGLATNFLAHFQTKVLNTL
jgi:hypothetical protein